MIPTLLFAFQAVAGVAAAGQSSTPAVSDGPVSAARSVHASRALKPPVLDGRDDDVVWRAAQRIVAFRVYDPVEDGAPPMETEAKVAYDDRYVYVFVRAFDPHPDSIRSYLSRRDVSTVSDHIKVRIDSYHDRRTGYEFEVNPAGVKHDWLLTGDTHEDDSWDGVWDVATRVDEKGWTAEFRIPLSQLRFAKAETQTFGLAISRDIARSNVHIAWPMYRRSVNGIASQFGDLEGLTGLGSPRRLEVLPYFVAKDLSSTRADGSFGRMQQATAGADVKLGLTSNLTVDATINPDFGQVEADPSVLNLTSFEQFYAEKRPFFLEGAGIFNVQLDCVMGCNTAFYSRRIGRAPQLAYLYGDAGTRQGTNILAATKLTGRLSNALSVGFLDAVTDRVTGPGGQTVEPKTNYFVGRLTQDFRDGKSALGVVLTATNRTLDSWSRDSLRKSGYTFGVDGRHRFNHDNYELTGFLVGTNVDGTAAAIASTQKNAVHLYQRPDARFGFDSTRTSLGGSSAQLAIAKIGGDITRFNSSVKQRSIGFELNDAGFLTRADQRSLYNQFGLLFQNPTSWYRSAAAAVSWYNAWNTEGLPLESSGGLNADIQFLNQWSVHAGMNELNVGRPYDDRSARGGPATPQLVAQLFYGGVEADRRWRVQPTMFVRFRLKDASGTTFYEFDPRVHMQLSSRFQASLAAKFFHQVLDAQWNGNFDTLGTRHYTFARLDQTVTTLVARLNFTATPTLTLQVYASPFFTDGTYSNWRELSATPRADNYADRFKPFTLEGDPGGFNVKQFRSNTVIRWEFRPGSTIFLVWTQGRDQTGLNDGTFNIGKDASNLFRTMPNNSFLIKTSYWFNF